jgi:hypothetical protein
MKHDLTVKSGQHIESVRFIEQDNGEVTISLTFCPDAASLSIDDKKEAVPPAPSTSTFPSVLGLGYNLSNGKLDTDQESKSCLPTVTGLGPFPPHSFFEPTESELIEKELLNQTLEAQKDRAQTTETLTGDAAEEHPKTQDNESDLAISRELSSTEKLWIGTFRSSGGLVPITTEPSEEPKKTRKTRKAKDTPVNFETSGNFTESPTPTIESEVQNLNGDTLIQQYNDFSAFASFRLEPTIQPMVSASEQIPTITPEQTESLKNTSPDGTILEVKTDEKVNTNQPSVEELTNFRARLFIYTNDILPKAGLVPTDGIGGVATKLRLYCQKYLARENMKDLTNHEWTVLLSHLDSLASDPVSMVNLINKSAGA